MKHYPLRGDVQTALRRIANHFAAVAVYAAAIGLVAGLSVHGAFRIAATLSEQGAMTHTLADASTAKVRSAVDAGELRTLPVASRVLADDNWGALINSQRFWRGYRSNSWRSAPGASRSPYRRSREDDDDDDDDDDDRPGWRLGTSSSRWIMEDDRARARREDGQRSKSSRGVYRTVCVRTCDGFFYPISFRTAAGDLKRDAATCSRTCSGGRLYIQRDQTDVDGLRDLAGTPYSKLKTAFLFRTKYDASCKCKPHAWEQASLIQHYRYGLQDRIRKGDRGAIATLRALNKSGQMSVARGKPTGGGALVASAPASDSPGASDRPQLITGQSVAAITGSNATPPITSAETAGSSSTAADATGVGTNVGPAAEAPPPRRRSRKKRSRPNYASQNRNTTMRLGGPAARSSRKSHEWVKRTFNNF